jgi:very-long-chain ceramide synthase
VWEGFPIRELNGLVKSYYLVASAFWLMQLVVVNIEEHRKDHLHMLVHHLIACSLMIASYCHHQTSIGNVILCSMDVVDIVLPLAKILKYLKFRLVCDIVFGAFMLVWFLSRHLIYMRVCWAVYKHSIDPDSERCYRGPTTALEGPMPLPDGYRHLYEPFLDPTGLVCTSQGILRMFLAVLLALQVIILIWFSMIINIAYKVVSGEGANDIRSDDEESTGPDMELDEESDIEDTDPCNRPIEEEVDFDEMRISSSRPGLAVKSTRRRAAKHSNDHAGTAAANSPSTMTTSPSVSLSGTSKRKELLGRIGCDKGS